MTRPATTIAERILQATLAGLPEHRRDWAEAITAELHAVPPTQRRRFALGAARATIQLRLRDAGPRPWLTGTTSALVLGIVNASSSDVANQASLAALLVGSAATAYAHPAAWRLTGIALGLVVPLSGSLMILTNQPPLGTPHGWTGVALLSTLCIPALAAAYGGSQLRRNPHPT